MAEKITEYKCPACDGPMIFDAVSGKLKCEYCDNMYSIEEVKAMYAEANKKVVENASVKGSDETWGVEDGMKSYSCQSCGAELICDDTTAATSCPYCGNTAIMPQQFEEMMRPKYVIPFKVDKSQIKTKMSNYYKGKRLLPKTFSDENHINEIKGVYVPFWLYSGTVETELSFDATTEERKRTQTEEIITTKHYDVKRRGTVEFSNIPTDASKSMPDDLMDSIEPYDYSELKDFEMEYLLGFVADKYDIEQSESKKRARERAVSSAISETTNTVTGYNSRSERENERKISYHKEEQEYAMLPVWLLNTKWNGESFLFAVNGQTGEMTGNLPVDRKKQLLWNLGVALPLFILSLIIAGEFTFGSFLIAAIVAGVGALITNMINMSSMKPVANRGDAQEYVKASDNERVKLSVKEDTYIRTTVEKRKIENNNK